MHRSYKTLLRTSAPVNFSESSFTASSLYFTYDLSLPSAAAVSKLYMLDIPVQIDSCSHADATWGPGPIIATMSLVHAWLRLFITPFAVLIT
jgi:hypothetical protein